MSRRSSSMTFRMVATASPSKPTSVIVNTSPSVSARLWGDHTPSEVGVRARTCPSCVAVIDLHQPGRSSPAPGTRHRLNISGMGRAQAVPDQPDAKRVQRRAEALLPEERTVGSDDASAQAAEILAESDARTEDRVSPPGKPVERRHSEDTVEPPD